MIQFLGLLIFTIGLVTMVWADSYHESQMEPEAPILLAQDKPGLVGGPQKDQGIKPPAKIKKVRCLPVKITNQVKLPQGEKGNPYLVQLKTSGGHGQITFSLFAGSLPQGLSLSESGEIAGTPSEPGEKTFTVLASDNCPETLRRRRKVFRLTIQEPKVSKNQVPKVFVPGAWALCNGIQVTIYGTNQDDEIQGTPGNDVIHGLGGDDTINGGDGDDIICGGDGNDRIFGGVGRDHIMGGKGDDLINGSNGDDKLEGGTGNDIISGGDGSDHIQGGSGDDSIWGGFNNDQLFGGSGEDFLDGYLGNDKLWGGSDVDRLNGGPGESDFCDGGTGSDQFSESAVFPHGCEEIVSIP
jgi:hypothetical protein